MPGTTEKSAKQEKFRKVLLALSQAAPNMPMPFERMIVRRNSDDEYVARVDYPNSDEYEAVHIKLADGQ